jgi:hypothetical protein
MVDRPMVYVAAPYRSDPAPNVNQAMKMADWMWNSGLITPMVPHLSILWDIAAPRTSDEWLAYDLALLARCDALFRLSGASIGADQEVEFATDSGIPVFHDESKLLEWAAVLMIDD